MRLKHWCSWSWFQSCIPCFKGCLLVWRLRMGSWISGGVLLCADDPSAHRAHVRSLAFALFKVAFLFAVSTTELCLSGAKTEMPPPSKAQVDLCPEMWLAWFCWRGGTAATSQHPLHLHLAHIPRAPGACLTAQKGTCSSYRLFPE